MREGVRNFLELRGEADHALALLRARHGVRKKFFSIVVQHLPLPGMPEPKGHALFRPSGSSLG